MRGRTSLNDEKVKEEVIEKTKEEPKEEPKELKKKKYYKVIVQNNDMIEGDSGIIDFFANAVRVIIEPGYPVLLGKTAFENLTKRAVQIKYKFTNAMDQKPIKYPFRRYPVTVLEEMELTEDERVKIVEQINKEIAKRKEEERKEVETAA